MAILDAWAGERSGVRTRRRGLDQSPPITDPPSDFLGLKENLVVDGLRAVRRAVTSDRVSARRRFPLDFFFADRFLPPRTGLP